MSRFCLLLCATSCVTFSSLLVTSCDGTRNFEKYTNINDVLKLQNGWKKTFHTQFGESNTIPNGWDDKWHEYEHRGDCDHCPFIWRRNEVENSVTDKCLRIKYINEDQDTDPENRWTKNITGCVTTDGTFEQAFGYWEVDAKFLNKHYGWAAFWLQCQDMAKESPSTWNHGGEDGSEIDIFESFNWNDFQNEVRLNTMADGYGDHYKEFCTSGYYVDKHGMPINIYNDFHKFGLLWTPDAYYMYVDHNLVFKTTAPIANHGMHTPTDNNHMGVCQVPAFALISGHMGCSTNEHTYHAPNGLPFDEYDGPGEFLIKDFVCYQNKHFEPYIKQPSDFY